MLLGGESGQIHGLSLTAGGGGNQLHSLVQQLLVLGIHQQNGETQFLQRGNGVLQLDGQDHQIRLQSGAALQIELLGGAHVGQVDQLGSAETVDGALVGLGLDAHQLVLLIQSDQQAGGDIVAADNALRLGLNGHGAAGLVGDGDGEGGSGRLFCLGLSFLNLGFRGLFALLVAGTADQRNNHHQGKKQCEKTFHDTGLLIVVVLKI